MVIKFALLVLLAIAVLWALHFLRVLGSRPPPVVRDRRKPAQGRVEDTQCCRVCNIYITAAGARDCGRPRCPYPGAR